MCRWGGRSGRDQLRQEANNNENENEGGPSHSRSTDLVNCKASKADAHGRMLPHSQIGLCNMKSQVTNQATQGGGVKNIEDELCGVRGGERYIWREGDRLLL